jgi:hypothetical protein
MFLVHWRLVIIEVYICQAIIIIIIIYWYFGACFCILLTVSVYKNVCYIVVNSTFRNSSIDTIFLEAIALPILWMCRRLTQYLKHGGSGKWKVFQYLPICQMYGLTSRDFQKCWQLLFESLELPKLINRGRYDARQPGRAGRHSLILCSSLFPHIFPGNDEQIEQSLLEIQD